MSEFIVALFKGDKIQLAFECNSRAEVDGLVGNTLSEKDGYMYFDDEIIDNFKKDDKDYNDEFYTGAGWYKTDIYEAVWVPGEQLLLHSDIYKIEFFINEEINEFKSEYPDVFLHAFNGNSLL